MTTSATVAIIPARGGSKTIPRKNIKPLGGKPLIAWAIELAKSIPAIDRVIVSTDDEEIRQVAIKHGAEAPFIRPAELAEDKTPTLPVLQHAVKYLQDNEQYLVENVLLFTPTEPFLNREKVVAAFDLLNQPSCRSVVGVRQVHGLVWKKEDKSEQWKPFYPKVRTNRQYFTHLYEEVGNIYFTKAEVLLTQNTIIDEEHCRFILMEEDKCLDIDTPADFAKAEGWVHNKTYL